MLLNGLTFSEVGHYLSELKNTSDGLKIRHFISQLAVFPMCYAGPIAHFLEASNLYKPAQQLVNLNGFSRSRRKYKKRYSVSLI